MDLVLLEEIVLFENVFEFRVYKYSDEINLNDKTNFICNLKVIINNVKKEYENKTDKKKEVLVLLDNLNLNYSNELENSIKNLVYDELIENNINKEDIKILIIKS